MNSNVGLFINNAFLKSKKKHKYALLWSSKFHQIFNASMRKLDDVDNNTAIKQFFSKCPNTFKFAQGFVEYFYSHGTSWNDIDKNYAINGEIYRGVTSNLKLSDIIKDSSFISTSYSYDVASKFATTDGSIIILSVNDLPKDIAYVVINEKIADYLQEDDFFSRCRSFRHGGTEPAQVVLLPGVIKLEKQGNKIFGKYEMYSTLVNHLKTQTTGGAKAGFTKQNNDLAKLLGIPRLTLRNKIAIFYRQIHNRRVEVLNWRWFPKTNAEVDKYMKEHIEPLERFYERTLHLYPDYKDIWEEFNRERDPEKRRALNKKLMSYTVLMAVYNYKTKEIEHYHYGIFDCMLSEADIDVTSRRQEIDNSLKEYIGSALPHLPAREPPSSLDAIGV